MNDDLRELVEKSICTTDEKQELFSIFEKQGIGPLLDRFEELYMNHLKQVEQTEKTAHGEIDNVFTEIQNNYSKEYARLTEELNSKIKDLPDDNNERKNLVNEYNVKIVALREESMQSSKTAIDSIINKFSPK